MTTKGSVLDGATVAAESRSIMKCGDCLHFQGSTHPGIGTLCESRGVKKYATAPNCFTANVHVFRRTSPTAFHQLATLLSSFTASQSRVFMGLLNQQAQLERAGFFLLERVYFCIGNDYLDNYYAAYVLGVGPEKQILLVGSDYLKSQKGATVAQLMKDSLMSAKDFAKKKAELIERGLIYEPRRPRKNSIEDEAEYVPPTLETPEALLEKNANKSTNPLKRKKKEPRVSHREDEDSSMFEVELADNR